MFEVLRYLNEHIREKLTLEGVAARFGYSKWYFCTLFKEYAGVNFTHYLRCRRMQLAAQDLLAGRRLVDIALDYGYESVGGFNKAFLKEYGCFPETFKQESETATKRYLERMRNMRQVSERCEYIRERVMDHAYDPQLALHRDYWFAKGVASVEEPTPSQMTLVSEGLASVIAHFPPLIHERELLVGNNYPVAEEWQFPGHDPQSLAAAGRFAGWERAAVDEAIAAWQRADALLARDYPGGEEEYCWFWGVPIPVGIEQDRALIQELAARGVGGGTDNHSVIGYRQVLELGFTGLLERVRAFQAQNGPSDLYRGLERICEAALSLGERYAAEARRLAADEVMEDRRQELLAIAATCDRVPRHPARNFREAVQSLLFAFQINTYEDYINANSLGRLDQILYPYYRRDRDSGALADEEAFELVCCLWLKLYRDYDVQQSCVGGTDGEGHSQVNDLSYMMLDATEGLGFVRCLSVRYGSCTEKAFLQRALEVVGHMQKGVPFFFNDDVMIPALIADGVEPADAADYTNIGCVETVIPGKENPHAVTAACNLLKALEYTLNRGCSALEPQLRPGLNLGGLEAFDTFEKLEAALYQQVAFLLDRACAQTKAGAFRNPYSPSPYKSLLSEGCLERNRSFNDFGCKYDSYEVMLIGIPNLADALAVLRKFVYETRRYTLAQVNEILHQNFPDEVTRLEFVNKAPKYGNDFDEVDFLARDLINFSCDCLQQNSAKYGLRFTAQPFTFLWMVEHGAHTAASADGRRSGEVLAYSMSPMQGRDFNGLTALVRSLCKLPTKRTSATTSAIVEVDPHLFTDRNIPLFADLMRAAAQQGLSNVQFNVVDADTLLDAQRHPERHRGLAVRVSGFSQKFSLLDRALQDHIINRTTHSSL